MFPDSVLQKCLNQSVIRTEEGDIPIFIANENIDTISYPRVSYTAPSFDGPFRIIKIEEEQKNMKEEPNNKPNKISIDRNDSCDRINVPLSRLEVTDVFRVVDDDNRNVYILIDVSESIDLETTDPQFVYALDVKTAKVVEFDKDTRVYVYNPACVSFKVGDFVKGY